MAKCTAMGCSLGLTPGVVRANLKQGHGVYTWPDGERYEGEFAADKMHGHGIFTSPRGASLRGRLCRRRCDRPRPVPAATAKRENMRAAKCTAMAPFTALTGGERLV